MAKSVFDEVEYQVQETACRSLKSCYGLPDLGVPYLINDGKLEAKNGKEQRNEEAGAETRANPKLGYRPEYRIPEPNILSVFHVMGNS